MNIEELIESTLSDDESFWNSRVADGESLDRIRAEYSLDVPIHPYCIFYESMSGAKVMDSPLAIYRDMINNEEYRNYWHIWSARSADIVPREVSVNPRTITVKRNTRAYCYFLARSKYLISNSVFQKGFVRRKEQKYLNTWHGIAYKALGRGPENVLGAAESVYNLLQATHVLTPCEYMTTLELDRFSLRHAHSGQIAELGYPRIDMQLGMTEYKTDLLMEEIGLEQSRKTVLYAPTWRGSSGRSKFDAERLKTDLKIMSSTGANVLFLAHHMMLRHIRGADFENVIVPPEHIPTNELIALSDILVTDYSSIFFDFLNTSRPIVHYIYDYDEYSKERSVLFGLHELPGHLIANQDYLKPLLANLLQSPGIPGHNYQEARSSFCAHDDGRAARRTVDWFFQDHVDADADRSQCSKESVLYWGGRLDSSGKALEFLERVNQAAKESIGGVVLLLAHSVKSDKKLLRAISKLDPNVSIVARNDHEMTMTSLESEARRLRRQGSSSSSIDADKVTMLVDRMYEREYRRIFGDSKFSKVVMYEGISPFWRNLAKFASL